LVAKEKAPARLQAEILETIIAQRSLEIAEKTRQIIEDTSLTLIEKIRPVIMVLPTHNDFYDLRILDQMKRYYPQQWAIVDASLSNDWAMLRQLIEQGIREGLIVDMNVTLMMKLIIDACNDTGSSCSRRFRSACSSRPSRTF